MALFKIIRRFAYLVILTVFAFIDMGRAGLSRRTFEFFAYDDHRSVAEARMLHTMSSEADDIEAYIKELILGPVSVDFAPLLTKGTQLRSFIYRDGVVYADFTREAALQVEGGRSLFDGFLALNQGIRRNFEGVSDVKLFVNGNEVFFGEFSKIFSGE
jgi:spore germination protein GerM